MFKRLKSLIKNKYYILLESHFNCSRCPKVNTRIEKIMGIVLRSFVSPENSDPPPPIETVTGCDGSDILTNEPAPPSFVSAMPAFFSYDVVPTARFRFPFPPHTRLTRLTDRTVPGVGVNRRVLLFRVDGSIGAEGLTCFRCVYRIKLKNFGVLYKLKKDLMS